MAVSKNNTPVESTDQSVENVTNDTPPQKVKPSPKPKAAPKPKTKAAAAKQDETKANAKEKVVKGDKGDKGDKDDNDSAGESSEEKPKLSAVPMPLVKKVKEQLDGIHFKNLSELKTVLETFINVIVETTKDGTSVTLPNYMTFKRVYRNERRHKNPKTKEEIVKPEHYVLSMYVKAQLKKQFEEIPVTDRPAEKQEVSAEK